MVEAAFWIALAAILYVYLGYPLLLMAWRRVGARPVRRSPQEPTVSLIITMHNEAHNVPAKMRNCLELDYPPEKLQIIVSLDAPTDGTDALVQEHVAAAKCAGGPDSGRRIDVVHSSKRRGKAAAINNGVALATGEIVVFADARQWFDATAIRELVADFADDSLGAVSGELILLDDTGREAADAVGIYWRYEKAIRSMEGEIHSVPGLTGAIYAIRRELFEPLPHNTVLDDVVIPMRIVLRGKRAIFEPRARAYDTANQNPEVEYEKKRRTLMGNYDLLAEMPQLLLPWRNPIFLQFVSHKVGRLIIPYCLAIVFVANAFLLPSGNTFYILTFAGQMLWYLLACIGWFFSNRRGGASMQPLPFKPEKNI